MAKLHLEVTSAPFKMKLFIVVYRAPTTVMEDLAVCKIIYTAVDEKPEAAVYVFENIGRP